MHILRFLDIPKIIKVFKFWNSQTIQYRKLADQYECLLKSLQLIKHELAKIIKIH